jgi:hypothetical protein
MMSKNLERMIALANESFLVHNDPHVLDVDEQVIEELKQIDPSTLSEYIEGDGPVSWVLLIPTTIPLMEQFIAGEIGEGELVNNTPKGIQYDALYLCSALTLPEFRNKGFTKKMALDAMEEIRNRHPIQTLFVWNFSKEGAGLSEAIALSQKLPIVERPRSISAV